MAPSHSRFKCGLCKRPFSCKAALEAHVRLHTGERLYKCSKCSKAYVLLSKLNRHMTSHLKYSERPHQCQICKKRFGDNCAYRRHIAIHEGHRRIYKCSMCQSEFKTHGGLHLHNKAKHLKSEKSPCLFCDKVFKSKMSLECHLKRHIGESLYTCHICDKSFIFKSILETHQKSHLKEGEMGHECPECGKKFSLPHNLKFHCERKHAKPNSEKFRCPSCKSKFFRISELSAHLKTTNCCPKEIEKRLKFIEQHLEGIIHPCKLCGNLYASQECLENHVRIHTNERPFKCDQCGKSYISNSHLLRHRNSHVGDSTKKFVCEICEKRFWDKCALKFHLTSHSTARPYKCKVCEKGFSTTKIRKNHEASHSDKREYSCDLCHARFRTSLQLKFHRKRMKPHKCRICLEVFQCRVGFYAHMKNVHGSCKSDRDCRGYLCVFCGKTHKGNTRHYAHILGHIGEKPEVCEICGIGFSQGSTLRAHMKRHLNLAKRK